MNSSSGTFGFYLTTNSSAGQCVTGAVLCSMLKKALPSSQVLLAKAG